MRICFFGGYDRDHPRNRVILSGLQRCGAQVHLCHSCHPLKPVRALSLIGQYWRMRNQIDLILVGSSGHAYVPLAWVLSRLSRKPLVFDAFVSVFESWQEDSRKAQPAGLKGHYAFWLDRVSAFLADVVLFDTEEHAAYFRQTFGLSETRVKSLPVGAESELFAPGKRSRPDSFRVFFAGSFLPLHGVEVILQAAELLDAESGIVLEIVGDGEEQERVQCSGRRSNMVFRQRVPYPEYARILSQADVALGIFGTTAKAARVIPCKVYDALAAGVPLVTSDTPAVRRVLRHGQNALLVPPGDARALADAVLRLKWEPALGERLTREGLRTFNSLGKPEIVGKKLLLVCAGLSQAGRETIFGRSPKGNAPL